MYIGLNEAEKKKKKRGKNETNILYEKLFKITR